MADKRDILGASLIFFSLVPLAAAFQRLGLLFCALLIVRNHQRQLTTEKFARKVIPGRHIFAVFSPRLAGVSRYKPFTWQKDSPPRRVPRASRQGAPGRPKKWPYRFPWKKKHSPAARVFYISLVCSNGRCVLSHDFGFFHYGLIYKICQALPVTGMTCDHVFLLFPFLFWLRSTTRISISSSTREYSFHIFSQSDLSTDSRNDFFLQPLSLSFKQCS